MKCSLLTIADLFVMEVTNKRLEVEAPFCWMFLFLRVSLFRRCPREISK